MDTDLLRAFVTTAEIKNFTKAATRLARTQSALSLQIRRLEDQLGVVLLHRDRRGVGLTSAGEVFLVHARHLLAVEDEAIRSVQRTRADEDLRLGIPDAYSSILLPGTVHALAELHPDARVHVTCAISTSLVTHFEHGELDLIVIIKHDHAPAGQVLCEEALLWVASRALHLDTQQPVPLALFPEPCLYRAHALRALAAARRDWQVVYTSQSTSAINIAIDEGWAVALKTPSTTHTNWQTLDATDHMPPLDPVRLELRIAPGRQSPALQTLRNLLATEAQRRIVHA
ncbi:MAG: LysR family transcriptional regulator, partial [Polyangiales bacterium]